VAKSFLLTLIIVACASIAVAQADYKRWEIFGGYSHNRMETGAGDYNPDTGEFIEKREGFHGFNASITRNFSRYFGLKGDVSGFYKRETVRYDTIERAVDIHTSLYNFLTGVQIKDNSTEATFKPFAHALPGVGYERTRFTFTKEACAALINCPAEHLRSNTFFAAALGGGLDIRASDRFDIRAIQVDYNPMRLGERTQDNLRIGVGIVIH